jgi:hypothetical protein
MNYKYSIIEYNKMNSQLTAYELDSQYDMNLIKEPYKYGNCVDVESLKLVDTLHFLSNSRNHILVIINGDKYGDRRSALENILGRNHSIYKDSNKDYYIYSKYGKLINIKQYFDFFKENKHIFILNTKPNKLIVKCIDKDYSNIDFQYEVFDFKSYSKEEYDNIMIQ